MSILLILGNNPVILMIRADVILVQEIKVVPAKAKIMDMVAIRHPSSNAEHRTTLILLCEDGSLRIYMASMQHTGYWLSSAVQAISPSPPRLGRKRKSAAAQNGKSSGMSFPLHISYLFSILYMLHLTLSSIYLFCNATKLTRRSIAQ